MGKKKKILQRQTGDRGCGEDVDVIPWANRPVRVGGKRELTFNWLLWPFPFLEQGSVIYFFCFSGFPAVSAWRAGGETARGQKEAAAYLLGKTTYNINGIR